MSIGHLGVRKIYKKHPSTPVLSWARRPRIGNSPKFQDGKMLENVRLFGRILKLMPYNP
jgi:hypothetical protein